MTDPFPSLCVSIVTFQPNLHWLEFTLRSVAAAISDARRENELGKVNLWLIDNTGTEQSLRDLQSMIEQTFNKVSIELTYQHEQGNVGYGAGHNLAMRSSSCDYHLVLNPDVMIAETALTEALRIMQRRPQVALLAPDTTDGQGSRQFLCKRYPSVFDLFLRGFAPSWIKKVFKRRLDHYELRDMIGETMLDNIPLLSGCFMLLRREAIAWTQGFDTQFFMYFEDFDLSLRVGQNCFAPQVRIMHFGGGAAQKDWRHINYFIQSAYRFYRKHGWKWW